MMEYLQQCVSPTGTRDKVEMHKQDLADMKAQRQGKTREGEDHVREITNEIAETVDPCHISVQWIVVKGVRKDDMQKV